MAAAALWLCCAPVAAQMELEEFEEVRVALDLNMSRLSSVAYTYSYVLENHGNPGAPKVVQSAYIESIGDFLYFESYPARLEDGAVKIERVASERGFVNADYTARRKMVPLSSSIVQWDHAGEWEEPLRVYGHTYTAIAATPHVFAYKPTGRLFSGTLQDYVQRRAKEDGIAPRISPCENHPNEIEIEIYYDAERSKLRARFRVLVDGELAAVTYAAFFMSDSTKYREAAVELSRDPSFLYPIGVKEVFYDSKGAVDHTVQMRLEDLVIFDVDDPSKYFTMTLLDIDNGVDSVRRVLASGEELDIPVIRRSVAPGSEN